MARIIVFKIYSQGRTFAESYKAVDNQLNSEIAGKRLVGFFNATGGNRDGSRRALAEVLYDNVINYQDIRNSHENFIEFQRVSDVDLDSIEVMPARVWFNEEYEEYAPTVEEADLEYKEIESKRLSKQ